MHRARPTKIAVARSRKRSDLKKFIVNTHIVTSSASPVKRIIIH